MSKPCPLCVHPRRAEIESSLLAGKTVREIGRELRISKTSVGVHRSRCMRLAIQAAQQSRQAAKGGELLSKLDGLLQQAMDVAQRARAEGNDKLLLTALREARETVRTMGEFSGAKTEAPKLQTSYTIIFEGGRPVTKALPGRIIEAEAKIENP
jgi:hypothetical protein